jgi:hypothetical protein
MPTPAPVAPFAIASSPSVGPMTDSF